MRKCPILCNFSMAMKNRYQLSASFFSFSVLLSFCERINRTGGAIWSQCYLGNADKRKEQFFAEIQCIWPQRRKKIYIFLHNNSKHVSCTCIYTCVVYIYCTYIRTHIMYVCMYNFWHSIFWIYTLRSTWSNKHDIEWRRSSSSDVDPIAIFINLRTRQTVRRRE